MGILSWLSQTTVAQYGRSIKAMPREMIFNRHLILTAMMFAMCGVPQTWDQGSSATVPSLKGFQDHFGVSSGSDADQIGMFVSIIYIGYTVGAAGSFFINNRFGRLWSYRFYAVIYIIGQIIAVFAPNLPALYAARIVSGMGIGSITVIGPIALVEISPAEIRGLITAWYVVAVSTALMVSNFCVYGIYLHMPASRLQYQVAWFVPCIYMALCILASFFLCESPRWLLLVGRRTEGVETLVQLRGLPADHPRVSHELYEIEQDLEKSRANDPGFKTMAKEMFTKSSNLRRLQQVMISYALAQLSGANSITSYFIPIMGMISDNAKGTSESIFLSGMYAFAKLFMTLIATFVFVDALGRRKSLLVGVTIQMVTHFYIGAFIKKTQEGPVSMAASQGAVAALFIHAFGYAVGLLILPYVFGSELWPNHTRSFGTALGSTFHWIFVYAIKYSVPSLMNATNDWGAFIFFGGWCAFSWFYVFFMVPEVSGMSVEEIEGLFTGPWFNAYRSKAKHLQDVSIEGDEDPKDTINIEAGKR
ncbi:hypothetical protein FSARC_2441 [Fusarium sarcochroum]|uniref:Major facilitator superfamily (MFS) profile domain-containing protein n=1 Tax=Fusarium sarcochroum TaxID=1208366 RepID=A0A8H4XD02_9HYPO|nr:hypothetical protein FSARC_2441 [Fusarium sarcochroum]